MKKILCILAVLSAFTIGAFAQDGNRVDLTITDSISTNLITTANTTKLGVRLGLVDNNIGIIAGGMLREGFCTADIDKGFPLDYYIVATPFIGIDIWNVELLGGLDINGSNGISPYISLNYVWDLIKPKEEASSGLSLKFGAEYYIDRFDGTKGSNSDSTAAGIGAAFVDIFSTFIPKVSVGVQYTFGKEF